MFLLFHVNIFQYLLIIIDFGNFLFMLLSHQNLLYHNYLILRLFLLGCVNRWRVDGQLVLICYLQNSYWSRRSSACIPISAAELPRFRLLLVPVWVAPFFKELQHLRFAPTQSFALDRLYSAWRLMAKTWRSDCVRSFFKDWLGWGGCFGNVVCEVLGKGWLPFRLVVQTRVSHYLNSKFKI